MKVEKKQAIPKPPPTEFVVTLTEEEATDLSNIMGCIAGTFPGRKTLDRLFYALSGVGVTCPMTLEGNMQKRNDQ